MLFPAIKSTRMASHTICCVLPLEALRSRHKPVISSTHCQERQTATKLVSLRKDPKKQTLSSPEKQVDREIIIDTNEIVEWSTDE
jgi:hypothetical protein